MQKKISRKGIPHHRAVASPTWSYATLTNARVAFLTSHRCVVALLIYSYDLVRRPPRCGLSIQTDNLQMENVAFS